MCDLYQAVFVTRVQLLHIKKTLENAAYEVLPAEAASGSGDPSGSGSKAAENGRGRNGDGSEPAHSRPFDWEFSLQLVLSTQAGLTLAEAAFSVRQPYDRVVHVHFCRVCKMLHSVHDARSAQFWPFPRKHALNQLCRPTSRRGLRRRYRPGCWPPGGIA